jgi:hypothetical protein
MSHLFPARPIRHGRPAENHRQPSTTFLTLPAPTLLRCRLQSLAVRTLPSFYLGHCFPATAAREASPTSSVSPWLSPSRFPLPPPPPPCAAAAAPTLASTRRHFRRPAPSCKHLRGPRRRRSAGCARPCGTCSGPPLAFRRLRWPPPPLLSSWPCLYPTQAPPRSRLPLPLSNLPNSDFVTRLGFQSSCSHVSQDPRWQ